MSVLVNNKSGYDLQAKSVSLQAKSADSNIALDVGT